VADRRVPLVFGIAWSLFGSAVAPLSAQVAGSKHDLSSWDAARGQGGRRAGDPCPYCHEASNDAQPTQVDAPSSRAGAETGSAGDISPPEGSTPGALTLFCLGCHDGTIARNMPLVDDVETQTASSGLLALSLPIGPDLSDDHPVMVRLDPASNPRLRDPAEAESLGLRLYGETRDQVECPSCHDPHDPTIHPFLRVSNAGSDLCLACHRK